jgi:ketosteroid isomerase-like protein
MSWREALFCLLALVSAASVAGAEPQRVRSDQEILIQLERDWDDALHRGDADFIETILADEYISTYPDGSRGDKAKELALTASFNQAVESSTVDEFMVKVFGDTAVVWFTQHVTGSSQGRTLEVTYRYVDVFVIRDGRWQCVTSQSTRVTATA